MTNLENISSQKSKVWDLRKVFNDGISFLSHTFAELDRKAQFWMGVSLTGLVGLPSYAFQKENLSAAFIVLACFCWLCLLSATFYLAEVLKVKVVATGVRFFPKDEGIKIYKDYLKSEQEWDKFGLEQAKSAFRAVIKNKTTCLNKAQNLGISEALLFRGIPLCLIISIVLAGFIHYINVDHFRLSIFFGSSLTSILYGVLVGIIGILYGIITHDKSSLYNNNKSQPNKNKQ